VQIKNLAATLRTLWDRFGDLLLSAGCLLLSLSLYVQTLAPSVANLFDDSLEFPLVAYRLAIAHPTGYPLYTLLGKLFTRGPGSNAAWSVNLLSAVAGAVTVALVYLVARELTRRRLPALLAALALAVSPVFWSQAVVAEVYTLNAAFVAGLLWLALRWARKPLLPVQPFSLLLVEPEMSGLFLPAQGLGSRLPQVLQQLAHRVSILYRRFFPMVPPRRRLRLHPLIYSLAFLFGLSMTHHRTAQLMAPALFVFAILVERRALSRAALLGPEHPERPRWLQILGRPVVLLAFCLLGPLLLYLYLPLRSSVGSLDGTYADVGFWRWVMASGYSAFLADNPLARDLDAAFYAELFWQQFGPVGLALAVVGVLSLFRKPKALALTGLAFLTYVTFSIVYRVPDVEVFFIPAFLVTAVWIGAGLDYALDLLRIRGTSLALRRALAVCSLLLVVLALAQPLFIAARNYPNVDLSRRWLVHDYGQYLLEQELPHDKSTVIGLGGEMTLLEYFQATTGQRGDVETIRADDEAARRQAVEAAVSAGRAVFITHPLPGLADDYALDAVTGSIRIDRELESLIRVGAPDDTLPDLPRPVHQEIVPGLELLGYGLREHHGHWQGWARLRLWWRTPQGITAPFKVSARLVDAGDREVTSIDAEPVSGAYPPTAWRPGEVVADAYEIPLPSGLPPGDYRPLVIVYDPATGAEQGRILLEPVYLQGSSVRPPQRALETNVTHTVYARFGDVELLGYTPPDPTVIYHPGDSLPLTLLWKVQGQPSGDMQVDFWLENIEDYSLGEEPVGGSFPTSQWTDAQIVRQWPALQVPGNTPAGDYRLQMRVTRDGQPVPWSRGVVPLGSDLDLGTVSIER